MKNLTERESNVAENRKPKLSPKQPDDDAQSRRFIEDAKLLEVDESGDAFERAMGVVAPQKDTAKHDKK